MRIFIAARIVTPEPGGSAVSAESHKIDYVKDVWNRALLTALSSLHPPMLLHSSAISITSDSTAAAVGIDPAPFR